MNLIPCPLHWQNEFPNSHIAIPIKCRPWQVGMHCLYQPFCTDCTKELMFFLWSKRKKIRFLHENAEASARPPLLSSKVPKLESTRKDLVVASSTHLKPNINTLFFFCFEMVHLLHILDPTTKERKNK